jgi:hypothetical protein
MRTTLDLPDELLTEIKVMCAQERATLKELIAELLRLGIRSRQTTVRATPLPAPYRMSRPLDPAQVSAIIREARR